VRYANPGGQFGGGCGGICIQTSSEANNYNEKMSVVIHNYLPILQFGWHCAKKDTFPI